MDPKIRAALLGVGALFLVSIIAVVIFALIRAGQSGFPSASSGGSLSVLPTIPAGESSNVPRTGGTGTTDNSSGKTYQGSNFTLTYPVNWGILTCNNSQNFEFDPVNSADTKGASCDMAVKSVTVLLTGRVSCPGEIITMGANRVIKSREVEDDGQVSYRWCLAVGNTGFDITHRVSLAGNPAASPIDYSAQIEQMISTIQPSSGTTSGTTAPIGY
ncbi:hypothetical protein A2617_03105 [Candidatus Daviesbacteria bacterium RIFOXYD1_FULL_41_10]|uniref:Uncharacterized protein n=3 Tax=Patescibacteria group TaxID=1783273 RepID=A0A1F5MZC8_9BACT|nr:MAG: hypothetical protein UU67_C0041G0007 [Candidatus Daviesbacteria bacterium GW2011_GWB1_41_5]KKT80750.1 MAG: hypothetical protein UW78_C0026G0008 [Candidatus Azambacteria bacterium GW2011_GWA1_44_9]OGE70738.1 MAG: hypothetical protein A2617_03105 [Candidatus Daviesbacteria bacterium RIFOXYD1_FULL_41_10]